MCTGSRLFLFSPVHLPGAFLAALLLLFAPPTRAETVNQSSEWLLEGAAYQTSDSFVLTQSLPRQSGSIRLAESVCADEFRLSFEIDLGTDVSSLGGDGVFVFFNDAGGTQQYRVHADTFFHSIEDNRYELDGNHVSIESLGAFFDVYGNPPESGNTTFGPLAAGKSPFPMEGSGWFYGEVHRSGRQLKITFSNGTAGLLLTTYLPADIPVTFVPGFSGQAINGMNEQKVRNISLSVLRKESCPDYLPPLTIEEARAVLVSSCGDVTSCPDEETFMACITQTTQELITDERLTTATAGLLELEAQFGLSFCQGYTQCEETIDPEAIWQEGYDSGYADGDAAGYTRGFTAGESAGYSSGYAAGDTDGYTRGHSEGYTSGFADGDASGYTRGFKAGTTEGFANGYAVGYQEGLADAPTCSNKYLTFEEALSIVQEDCSCNQYRNTGQRTVCSVRAIKTLQNNGRIPTNMQGELVRAMAQQSCDTRERSETGSSHSRGR